MKNKQTALLVIHESLVNGQRKQMADQIDEYGLYDFWLDYFDYLQTLYHHITDQYVYFRDAVISYHHIRNR